jgi:hypothetical protein
VVQDSLTRTADSASELGGFGEDTALNWALLDLLEFYESLYTENLPQMIEVGFAGDREQYRELNQAYQARLKGELPPLEQKYIQAEREFASKYGLTQTSGSSGGGDIRDKINRHLNFQSKHGSQRDKERAKRIQEQLKEMDQ